MTEKKMVLKPKSLEDIMEEIESGDRQPHAPEVNECRDLLEDFDYDAINAAVESEPERMLTIDEAASFLGISKQTLRNWEKEGKLNPVRTTGGHRRYTKSQVNGIRMQQMNDSEILLHDIKPANLLFIMAKLLSGFDSSQPVNFTISTDQLERKVRFTIDSADGLTTVSKTFSMED